MGKTCICEDRSLPIVRHDGWSLMGRLCMSGSGFANCSFVKHTEDGTVCHSVESAYTCFCV